MSGGEGEKGEGGDLRGSLSEERGIGILPMILGRTSEAARHHLEESGVACLGVRWQS